MTTVSIDALKQAPVEDCWGFYGTLRMSDHLSPEELQRAWEIAFDAICEVPARGNTILTRNFLRSRYGRHFADMTCNFAGTVAERIQQASGEYGVRKMLDRLICEGGLRELFEEDPALV
ncbi:hypothetical protein H5P28_00140 [Ruficoccus amylovorans]|uniref:Uncharacterized protein n=1 Tax=Ruficoccus amylovorans TaxID=1804625 RepID=A0A842H8I5_9BACT|nr:hypothetical protein [Ruficoccus amylovorans]MBC2592660.1 hypothetical protein [Ruficoccus amylovorans]